MKRTILYYPTMAIANQDWIRQVLFYWDEIGTIVPNELALKRKVMTNDLRPLFEAGAFRLFHPEDGINNPDEFAKEFFFLVKGKDVRVAERDVPLSNYDAAKDLYLIHSTKANYSINGYSRLNRDFAPRSFVEYLVNSALAIRNGDWLVMRRSSALLYMSLLAKYLADSDASAITTPGTDYINYQDILFKNRTKQNSLEGISFILKNVLPVPRSDVPFTKIIEFKKKREVELLEFRKVIYRFEDNLKQSRDAADLKESTARFSEEIRAAVIDLNKIIEDSKIPTLLGAVENIIKIETPAIIAGIASLGKIPVEISIAGAMVAGTITLRKYLIDARNAQREKLAANSFSYLYHSQQEGIT